MNYKINQAFKKGDLIAYEDLFASYPKKRQQEILKRARYFKAAMELRKLRKQLKISQNELARKMKVKREFIVLLLENGEEIEITYPVEIAEDMFEEMREAQSRDAFWYVGNYSNARAIYKGFSVDHINMKRVVGMA